MTTNYSYNSIGLNTKMVDRNGSSTSISYDGLNRITDTNQTGADNQSSLGYKYNYNNPFGPSSVQLYINGSLATQNQYSYGVDGQITKKDTSGEGLINSNLKLQYDNAGRLKSVGTGIADSNYFYTNYKYTNGRITKVQTNGAQTDDSGDNANAAYDYYPDGKLKKITYPKLNDNSYLTSEYVYNALGRLTSLTNRKGNAVISQYLYTYDLNGNITSVNDGQTTKTYTYDKLNRLKTIQPQTGSKIVYTYDLRGNRITETKTPKFVLNNVSYTYDLENRLESVAKGQSVTRMSYYADGLRAKKDSSLGSTSYQYNTSGQLIAEVKNSSTVTTNYIWGPDRVLEKKDVSGGEYYYLYNGHGDVVQMVDKNGNVVNNYQYDEWGNITTNSETVSNPFKYAGEVYDEETGLYYLRARYYDPQLGRFLNEDSVEGQVDNPLTLNVYTYCYNNPLKFIDPSGHKPGDLFTTENAAAADFGKTINKKSIKVNREYSAVVYKVVKNKKTFYTYTKPKKGSEAGATVPDPPKGKTTQSILHTHAAYDPDYDNENFSDADKNASNNYTKYYKINIEIYVVTPNGSLKKYDPKTGKVTVISKKMPYDPHDPNIKSASKKK